MQPNTPVPPPQRDPSGDPADGNRTAHDDSVADQMHLATSALRAIFPMARGGRVRDESDSVDA